MQGTEQGDDGLGGKAPGSGGGRRGCDVSMGAAPQKASEKSHAWHFHNSCFRPYTHFNFPKIVQTRKPYTMTKQRERWTDEEHQRFVEALRIHGRQWRKIEGKELFCCFVS